MKKIVNILATFATAILVSSCGPYKTLDVVEVKPNETAWVIPLDGESKGGQAKFNSVDFLDQKKVATKRIMVDKVRRDTGRMPGDYEWIPAVRVIKVDRSLVTREWTDNTITGTKQQTEGIPVNTKDNIKLTVGLTITCSISEEDASGYLYYHGEKTLAEVMDQNIRSYAVAELNHEVSSMMLSEFQTKQTEIYETLFKDAVKTFKEKGITVHYLGNSEGWHFKDKEIQESINKTFVAQQSKITAQNEQETQKITNETLIMKAQTTADAAQKLFQAQEAAKFQNELEVSKMNAEARLKMAEKWSGSLPTNILPANSPLLMNLGEVTK